MQIVYTGPAAGGVTIAATGQHATPGEALDVAEDVARSLLEQDVWSRQVTDLASLSKPELVAVATAAGVDATGTRPVLLKRLQDLENAPTDDPATAGPQED